MRERDRLPAAPEAEKQVLGSILLLPEVAPDVFRCLEVGYFVDGANASVYGAMLDLYRVGKPIDASLIADRLRCSGEFVDRTPAAYLLELGQITASAANVNHYVSSVAEAAAKRRVFTLAHDAAESARNGSAASETINALRSDLDDLERRFGRANQFFQTISAAQLATELYEVRYLVDGLLVEGQPCIVAGEKKSLKTSLLLDLSIALSAGGCFLGVFHATRSCRTLYCSGESGPATLQETSQRICHTAGYSLSDLSNFVLTPNLPRFDDASNLAEFERLIQGEGAEIVIIDPAYLCMPGGDAGNLFVTGDLLRGISEACQRQSATLVLAHHTRKSIADPFQAPELADIAWAGFQEFARQWLLVGRRERYEPGSGLHRLWLSAGGSAGHGGLWALDIDEGRRDDPGGRRWVVDVKPAHEARDDERQRKVDAKAQEWQKQLEADKAAACRVLAKHPAGLTKTAIGERAGIPNRRWPKVLAAMIDDGDLAPCEVKVSNHKLPREGYRLADRENT